MSFDILIISNGPGELSSWVKPLVKKINETLPEARIIICLVPCIYASGEEYNVAIEFTGVSYVMGPRETGTYLLAKKLPEGFSLQEKGIVLHMGGDQIFTVLMSRKTKFPAVVYTENLIFWTSKINRFLLTDQNLYASARLRKIEASKLSVVGNLMVDAVSLNEVPQNLREKLGLSTDKSVVTLLPGSKPFKVKYSTPYMLRIADYIAKKNPDTQFLISQSPYTPLNQIVGSVTIAEYIDALEGVGARFGKTEDGNVLVTEQGTIINIVPPELQYEAYQVSDVAITLPGTNTAELAILGIPMVVLFPMNKLDEIPVEGLIGAISDIPFIGKYIKRFVIKQAVKKMRFVALPNQKMGAEVTPELVGNIIPLEVAERAIKILNNPYERREISLNLKKTMGASGASKNVISNIVDVLLRHYDDMEILENINNYTDWTKRESENDT
jgi:hypothetical protein